MGDHQEARTAVGIVLLYTMITSIFSFLQRLVVFITEVDGFRGAVMSFFQRNGLWIIVAAGVIIMSYGYMKKLDLNFYFDILQNRNICLITGVLVVLGGLISLSSIIPLYVMSINSSIQILQRYAGQNQEGMVIKSIISNVVSVVIILCQILFGIYLVKFNRKN
ncbi:hypothetical protein [Petroclostridium sp. X23]|uniref:hypothetical protein n=1 Tax=Petroclostridium sp. X23 TaxID=3045146 RepID=UPI0024AD9151|nr:hypothetical protein [Petroclostridium sp. X23]WHH60198.1 hypothetical protein QKW49_05550 [Petroclostridium sp. X23]